MKQNRFLKMVLSYGLIAVLIAAMVLLTASCGKKEDSGSSGTVATDSVTPVGTGSISFDFSVVDKDGKQTDFRVSTEEKTVGAALQKLGLIDGDQDQYGLYVKTVNGITADYDKDGCYWAFYENGKYASSGVDQTGIDPDVKYMMKIEKS